MVLHEENLIFCLFSSIQSIVGIIMLWFFRAKFWILLILSIPSIICSILILIYFYRKRQNILIEHHLIIVLIITSLLQITTDTPFHMDYYQRGTVIYASNVFCTWWNWWEYSTSGLLLFGMAWGSVERHLLVFHRVIVATRRNRFFFHFLPMLIACIYPSIFYFTVMVLNSCKNQWDYNTVLCLLPCYLTDQPALATYDFLGNIAVPILIITMANVCLILRVLWQKRHHHAAWHRQRKLTRQLMSIAMLYMLFWFPLTFNGLIMIFAPSSTSTEIQVNYCNFLIYMVPILLPFISFNFLSDFTETVFKRQPGTVVPLGLQA